MEPKNRQVIVVTIIILIVLAMFASFGRSLFALRTPQVVLPSTGVTDSSADSSQDSGLYQQVAVTPKTAPSVVATLARPESYYRELTIETFWEGGSSSAQVQVWKDGGWSHSRQTLPSGVIRHDLTDGETLYYWYEGASRYETAPADQYSSDFSQHIPTYETVVDMEEDWITDAGYETRGELPCVYVQVQLPDSPVVQRYWVSVDSGLLVSAEAEEDGTLVYRMTAYSPAQSPCPADGEFALPDGTVLHTPESPATQSDPLQTP